MAPKFYFRVDEMQARSCRTAPETQEWLPPEAPGHNVLVLGGITNAWYLYDHHRTGEVTQLPQNAERFKEYSIYHNEGRIWIVPYDATRNAVGHANESNGWIGWRRLGFLHSRPPGTTASLATYAGNQPRLAYQRPDQRWVRRLLPPDYHALEEQRTVYQGYGGMNGHLPIIIALIVFSARTSQAHAAVTHCLHEDSWRSWTGQREWRDQRGLVVRVYLHPDTDSDEMENFENGYLGTIYP